MAEHTDGDHESRADPDSVVRQFARRLTPRVERKCAFPRILIRYSVRASWQAANFGGLATCVLPDTLDTLPPAYDRPLYAQKCAALFEHVYESYPSLWSKTLPRADRTPDQHDAWSVAEWLRRADVDGGLAKFLNPNLSAEDLEVAEVEGWILGLK